MEHGRPPNFFIHFVRNVAAHVLNCSYGLFFYEAEITKGAIPDNFDEETPNFALSITNLIEKPPGRAHFV